MGIHPELSTVCHDVEGLTVLMMCDDNPVGHRRCGQLGHLFAKFADVVACLAQGELEFLILSSESSDLALGIQQTVLGG